MLLTTDAQQCVLSYDGCDCSLHVLYFSSDRYIPPHLRNRANGPGPEQIMMPNMVHAPHPGPPPPMGIMPAGPPPQGRNQSPATGPHGELHTYLLPL